MWPHHCRGLRDLILPPAMMGPRVGLDAVIVSELSPFAPVMFSSTSHACLPFKRHFANPVFFPSPLLSPRFVSKASGSLCVFANNHVIVLGSMAFLLVRITVLHLLSFKRPCFDFVFFASQLPTVFEESVLVRDGRAMHSM